MRNFTVISLSILLFTFISIQAAKAVSVDKGKVAGSDKMINAKCHVALIDGSEAVLFWRTKPEHLSKLSKRIAGQSAAGQKSIERIRIYRAFECVAEGSKFSSLKAQTLDKTTKR